MQKIPRNVGKTAAHAPNRKGEDRCTLDRRTNFLAKLAPVAQLGEKAFSFRRLGGKHSR
jgi:hypothetical protein